MKAHKRSLSHEEVLGGRLAAKTSFTVNRMGKQQEEELIGESSSASFSLDTLDVWSLPSSPHICNTEPP